jgi:hypothetical protein
MVRMPKADAQRRNGPKFEPRRVFSTKRKTSGTSVDTIGSIVQSCNATGLLIGPGNAEPWSRRQMRGSRKCHEMVGVTTIPRERLM